MKWKIKICPCFEEILGSDNKNGTNNIHTVYFNTGLIWSLLFFYFKCSNTEMTFLGCIDSRAELQVEHRTSLRTMLLSSWSRRMLSNVPHRPPLMFWQLAQRAWHPLGTEERAAPKPKLANLTWCRDTCLGERLSRKGDMPRNVVGVHHSGNKSKNTSKLGCCWCYGTPVCYNIKYEGCRVDLSREPQRLTCVGKLFLETGRVWCN